MNGELTSLDDGRWSLRFTRQLAHPVDKVWRALTQPDHLQAWFPQRIVGDLLTPGAVLRFEDPEDGPSGFEGRVVAVEPLALLEILWGTDTVRFEIIAGVGSCTLVLTDIFDEMGKAARDGAGWHTCLDFLEAELDGAAPTFTSGERWKSVHRGYVDAFGSEASTVGPPPEWDPSR
jgi:uncharacterized protein YndB with AHSA1/START domain